MEDLDNGGKEPEAKPKSKPRYVPEIVVGVGYLLFFVLVAVACVAALFMIYSHRAVPANSVELDLPSLTATPHVLSTPVMGAAVLFQDGFTSNANLWGPAFAPQEAQEEVQVKDGKLLLTTLGNNQFVTAMCGRCPTLDKPFYAQAEFTSEGAANVDFGIMLGERNGFNDDHYYLLLINTDARKYSFYYYGARQWYLRGSGIADQFHSLAATNTIGIYINGGYAEFYVNGGVVDSLEDSGTSFQRNDLGFYAASYASLTVQIDNVIIENLGGK